MHAIDASPTTCCSTPGTGPGLRSCHRSSISAPVPQQEGGAHEKVARWIDVDPYRADFFTPAPC